MKTIIPYIRRLVKSLIGSHLTAHKCIDRAYAKIELQDYKGAIAAYTKAIEIDPRNAVAYFYREILKIEILDRVGALVNFTKTIEIEPTNSIAYSYRGRVKILLRDIQGAIDDFTKSVEIPLLTKGGLFGDVAHLLK
jgi:tetratricopeptide (TPR) repeat protein